MPTLLLANLSPLLVPLGGFILVGTIVVAAFYFKNQRRRLWHETARLALEKGQPLPAIPDSECSRGGPLRDLRSGLILLAIAVGLYAGMAPHRGSLTASYMIGGVGLALLLNSLIAALIAHKASPNRRPPDPS